MTHYEQEIKRIAGLIFSNQAQIDKVIATRKYIESNSEKDLNLDLLSEALFTSKFHLQRLFKKHYGVSPKQYLISKRVENAKAMLKEGTSVTETCFAVGFESLGSFSTLFKKRTGRSPSQFVKEQVSRSN